MSCCSLAQLDVIVVIDMTVIDPIDSIEVIDMTVIDSIEWVVSDVITVCVWACACGAAGAA